MKKSPHRDTKIEMSAEFPKNKKGKMQIKNFLFFSFFFLLFLLLLLLSFLFFFFLF